MNTEHFSTRAPQLVFSVASTDIYTYLGSRRPSPGPIQMSSRQVPRDTVFASQWECAGRLATQHTWAIFVKLNQEQSGRAKKDAGTCQLQFLFLSVN